MPSIVTSIIGGFQGASAAHNAANELQTGYNQAGTTVTNAVNQVNPNILNAASTAGQNMVSAAGTAGQNVVGAAGAGGTGATTAAGDFTNALSPYTSAGATAAAGLTDAAKPFTASMMAQYSPAYQFQLQQGQQAAARAAAASGVTGSGGTLKAASRYAQDYAGTAFTNASNLYNQNFQRLQSIANMGEGAATTAGQANLQAAEYAGNLGVQGAEYAGNAGMQGAEYQGNANINATNLASQNTLSGAGYLANTQIGARQAQAQGDLGAANSWNQMLSGVGAAGNMALGLGFGGPGSSSPGSWNISNIGTNLGNMYGGGGGYGGYGGYVPNAVRPGATPGYASMQNVGQYGYGPEYSNGLYSNE